MKVVINRCYGGFGLSDVAIKRWAELKGRGCYAYKSNYGKEDLDYRPATEEEMERGGFVQYFDIPDFHIQYDAILKGDAKFKTDEVKKKNEGAARELYNLHQIYDHDIEREDPDLIRVVEELGSKKASGFCAQLAIEELPDGANYVIEEYDGSESIEPGIRSYF